MRRLTGVFLVVVSAAAFGTLAIFARFAFADSVDAVTLSFFRFTLAAAGMAVPLAARREPLPRGRTLGWLIAMGALGYVGQSSAYLTALQFIPAGTVALLLYLYPIFVAALSAVFLKERLTRVKFAAMGLALVGMALTVGPEWTGRWQGVALALTGAAIYSVYILVGTHVMRRVTVFQSSTVILASAGLTFGAWMAARGPHLPATAGGWLAILGVVVVSTILPVATFLAGLERIGPTNAAMLSTLEPVVTVLLAAGLLGEAITPLTVFGGALILAAVLLLTRAEVTARPEESV